MSAQPSKLLFVIVKFSVVTIVSEPASIDYDWSFEKYRNVDSMLHGQVDWQFPDQCQLMYCMLWFDTQRVETVKLLVRDTLRQAPNIKYESYTTNDVRGTITANK